MFSMKALTYRNKWRKNYIYIYKKKLLNWVYMLTCWKWVKVVAGSYGADYSEKSREGGDWLRLKYYTF